jgi:hypothetical protein
VITVDALEMKQVNDSEKEFFDNESYSMSGISTKQALYTWIVVRDSPPTIKASRKQWNNKPKKS